MGLFDKVRQVLARGAKVLPGSDQDPEDGGPGPAPGTAEPARTMTDPAPEAGDVPEPGEVAGNDAGSDDAGDDVPEEPRRYRTHTLVPDQTLAEVAELHGVSVEQVAELNGLDPELVFAGQVVRIPHH